MARRRRKIFGEIGDVRTQKTCFWVVLDMFHKKVSQFIKNFRLRPDLYIFASVFRFRKRNSLRVFASRSEKQMCRDDFWKSLTNVIPQIDNIDTCYTTVYHFTNDIPQYNIQKNQNVQHEAIFASGSEIASAKRNSLRSEFRFEKRKCKGLITSSRRAEAGTVRYVLPAVAELQWPALFFVFWF